MKIYTKILLAVLSFTFLNFAIAVGTTYYFSHKAIQELAEAWLATKLIDAHKIAEGQEKVLHSYALENIPASVQKAKLDAGAAIAQIEVGMSGYIFAVDNNGKVCMHPDGEQVGRDISTSALYQQIQRKESRLSYIDKGEKYLAMYSNFQPWDWTFIVIDPEQEVFHSVDRMKPYLIALGLAGSFIAALILVFVVRRVTGPLRLLTLGVEKISKGDLNARIPILSGDEIGRLSLGFNKMAQQLYASHHELEKRVEKRTRELTQVNRDLQHSIEEKNRAVGALQLNERRLQATLTASPIGIGWVVDRKLGWANEKMYAIVDHDKNSLLKKSSRILYSTQEEFERVGNQLYREISTQKIGKVETQWMKRDGTLIDCAISACALDPADHSKGMIVTVADITTEKNLVAKLQRAQKMEVIGTLAGGVAHDLNNILSGIVSYPELMLLELPKDSPLTKPLTTIKKSGERAAIIVQDLLTMARRGVAVTEVINLNDIVKEQLEGPEIRQLMDYYPEINSVQQLDEKISNVKGSRAHLAKSITNLVSNAAEAMVRGGQITITTEDIVLKSEYRGYEIIKEGRYVVLMVEDNGVGIVKTDLEHIFEPFYTKKRMGRSGTGLGMAVVWGTVKDHDGFVDVKSTENIGTTFRLFFPATAELQSISKQPDPIDLFRGSGERVLVIDDSDLQREVAERILQKLNYEVTTVESGEKAVKYLDKNETDLLVLDMIMPNGIDGLETYRQIIDSRPEQRVVIASGFSETDRVKEIQRLSGGPYLKKPYTIEKLGKLVRQELKRDE